MAEKEKAGNTPATTNQGQQQKVTALQKLESQMNSMPNLRSAITLPYWEEQFVKNYEASTGKKDGKNRFMDEAISLSELAIDNPKINECSRISIGLALRKVGSTGLSFKSQGHLYAIPIGKHLKIQVGAHGKKQMLRMMPTVKFVHEGEVVVHGDEFIVDKLSKRILKHESTTKSVKQIQKLEDIQASYVRLEYTDGRVIDMIVPFEDLVKARAASKNKGEGNTWVTWPAEMAKKVAYHRLFKNHWEPNDSQVEISEIKEEEEENTKETTYTDATSDFMPPQEPEVVQTEGGDKVDTGSGEVINDKKEEKKDDKKPKDFFGN